MSAPPPDDETKRRGDAHLIETRMTSEDVFEGKLLHVKRDTVRLPDGKTATREYIAHPGAVMIIPRLPDGKLLMERQFRYPLARIFIEFPAGKIDPGEEPAATAARELLEETGYTAERWAHIGTLHPLITYSTEHIEIYIADALTFVGVKLDAGEFVEIFSATLEEALAWVDRGEITDVKTMLGLLLLARRTAAER
jgi:ADP-ribose pyrophosphatase